MSRMAFALVLSLALSPALASAVLLAAPTTDDDDLAKLRGKLALETRPVRRAKISVKVGRALLKQTRHLYREGAYTDAEERLSEYVTTVTNAYDELLATGRNARKHPSGFKELEIHLRKTRRSLAGLARSLPVAVRPKVAEAARTVGTMRSNLLNALMAISPPTDERQ